MGLATKIIDNVQYRVQRYNPKKYWKYREYITDENNPKIIRFLKLYKIKKSDAFNCASMGTSLDNSAYFANAPHLPHGLNGIIISRNAKIGKNAIIYQQVTIGQDQFDRAPVIGDNVLIYPGSKIVGNIKIGKNVTIGAGSVVVKDIEDNAVVAGVPAKVIKYNLNK